MDEQDHGLRALTDEEMNDPLAPWISPGRGNYLGASQREEDAPLTEPLCAAEFHDPYEGAWLCSLRPGHHGEHEDSSGHWWPRDDQLETW
jgi:hypothetical protein